MQFYSFKWRQNACNWFGNLASVYLRKRIANYLYIFLVLFFLQSKPGEIALAVETAIESGYRLIDTAFVYGNEKEIGESLQKLFKKGTVKREELFITTKVRQICGLIFFMI